MLAVTVVVSCAQLHHVSQESLRIQHCLIHLACSDLFVITFLAMLLIQQNDQQGIKGLSFQLHVRAEKHQEEFDQVAC